MAIKQGRGMTSTVVDNTLRNIFKRCVNCPTTTPSCPSCGKNEICSLQPQSCQSCAYATCIKDPNASTAAPGPNVGAIAGGVVGGVVAVVVIVFFVWRFYIKKKREQQELEAEEWEGDDIAQQKATHRFTAMQSDAASTRTRGSLANSFLSRASNIIQIAYIPGVTNRNGSGHNSMLSSTPVPPIPAQTRGSQPPKSPLSNEGDALFFRPGDLRDSTWSGTSSLTSGNRDTQYTRRSITPSLARSSLASDIYRDDATEYPMPATAATRVAPRMVSVKSASSGGSPSESPGSDTLVSSTDYADFAANTPGGKGNGVQIMMPGQGLSPSSSMRAKAKQVTVGGKGRFPIRQVSDASTAPSTVSKHAPNVPSPLAEVDDSTDDDDDEHARARRSLLDALSASARATPLVQPVESPFFDASETLPATSMSVSNKSNPYKTMASTVGSDFNSRTRRGNGRAPLSDIIEEATKRASKVPSHEGLGGKGDMSPFSDTNSIE